MTPGGTIPGADPGPLSTRELVFPSVVFPGGPGTTPVSTNAPPPDPRNRYAGNDSGGNACLLREQESFAKKVNTVLFASNTIRCPYGLGLGVPLDQKAFEWCENGMKVCLNLSSTWPSPTKTAWERARIW